MKQSWLNRTVLAVLLVASTGCATAHGVAAPAKADHRNVLEEQDLAPLARLDAFEALRRLKPHWLSGRGQTALLDPERQSVRVYLDGMLNGDVASLRRVSMQTVGQIQFLDSRTATLRFGTGHAEGAILVTTRHGRR